MILANFQRLFTTSAKADIGKTKYARHQEALVLAPFILSKKKLPCRNSKRFNAKHSLISIVFTIIYTWEESLHIS